MSPGYLLLYLLPRPKVNYCSSALWCKLTGGQLRGPSLSVHAELCLYDSAGRFSMLSYARLSGHYY